MDNEQRDKLVSDVKALQKLTRNLERSSLRIGKENDTTSWRRTFQQEIQKGVDIVQSLQATSQRIRSESINAQADKLLQQSLAPITKFQQLKSNIDYKLSNNEPINDDPVQNESAYGSYNATSGGQVDFDYQQQQQKQDQVEEIGLVALGADIKDLEDKNQKVQKIAEDVKELKEAYTDLNVLVNEQGEQLDHIEQNVEAARDQVETGVGHLETAEKHQISARKKQCLILCICLIFLAVLFGLLGGFGAFN